MGGVGEVHTFSTENAVLVSMINLLIFAAIPKWVGCISRPSNYYFADIKCCA